jgi:hypothetical protein
VRGIEKLRDYNVRQVVAVRFQLCVSSTGLMQCCCVYTGWRALVNRAMNRSGPYN